MPSVRKVITVRRADTLEKHAIRLTHVSFTVTTLHAVCVIQQYTCDTQQSTADYTEETSSTELRLGSSLVLFSLPNLLHANSPETRVRMYLQCSTTVIEANGEKVDREACYWTTFMLASHTNSRGIR